MLWTQKYSPKTLVSDSQLFTIDSIIDTERRDNDEKRHKVLEISF